MGPLDLPGDHGSLHFRPVTPGDERLLFELYASTRDSELAQVPWSEAQKAAFVQMQFNAQASHYASYFPQAEYLVIELGNRAVGRLYLDRRSEALHILDLTLLPEARSQGLGTRVLQGLLAEAAQAGLDTSIYVESFNPSMRLFERLGFQQVSADGMYCLLSKPA